MSNRDDRKSARSPVWLVGKVQGGMEFVTAGRLRRQGVRVKCPGYVAIIRPARKKKPIKRARAAFPGYIFIDRNSVVDLERICLKTKGFLCVVTLDDDYSACDDDLLKRAMEYLRKLRRENYFGSTPVRMMKQKIKAGVAVTISEGVFRGFESEVIRRRGDNLTLSIEIFGQETEVIMPVTDVVLKCA